MKLQRRIFVISAICALLLFSFLRLQSSDDFADNSSGPEIEFSIQDGELGSLIAQNLESKGVIKSSSKFIEEFNKDPKAQGISAGSHSIQTRISVKTAIAQLLDPKRLNNVLVVKEGSTFSDVMKLLKSNDDSASHLHFQTHALNLLRSSPTHNVQS